MIARLWTAHTTPALSDSYLRHFERAVHPALRKLAGFLGAAVAVRPSPGSVEILVTTYWQSFDAIEAFVGSDRDAAVIAPEAAALLTDYDKRVRHYELAQADFPKRSQGTC